MSHNKFKAGETQGTYVPTEPATAEEILAMANRLARARVTKGKALTSPSLTQLPANPCWGYERGYSPSLFWIANTALSSSRNCSKAHWMQLPSTRGSGQGRAGLQMRRP